MRLIGKLSYSLYIWQQFFFGGMGYHLPKPLAVVALAACASISYWCIEQPAIRFGRRFIKRRAPVSVPVG
jgi:peptidoglycan/LPS O-acetylase OafA/YrhL